MNPTILLETSRKSFAYHPLTTASISSKFTSNSEALALENLEEVFLQYYIRSDILLISNHVTVYDPLR